MCSLIGSRKITPYFSCSREIMQNTRLSIFLFIIGFILIRVLHTFVSLFRNDNYVLSTCHGASGLSQLKFTI